MRILNILLYSPCPPHFGGALRVFHLLNQMVQRNEVTVVMFGTREEEEMVRDAFGARLQALHVVEKPGGLTGVRKRLAQFGSLIRPDSAIASTYASSAMQDMIDRVSAGREFDLVQIDNFPMGFFRVNARGAARILSTHNIDSDHFRRMAANARSPLRRLFYGREQRKLRREEISVLGAQDAILVTSDRDRSLLEESLPHLPKYVVPNGVDTSYFRPFREAPEPLSLVFTGAMNYFPNVDGILYFLSEIFPLVQKQLPSARVFVVGGGPPRQLLERASESVVVTGFVEDVRPYIHRSSVYVVPLRMGGGTRLKVLEAIAMEIPVVTTTVGCEGIAVADRESVLVADTPRRFADAVIELIRDRRLARALVKKGSELVKTRYEWSVIGNHLAEVQSRIVNASSGRNVRYRLSSPGVAAQV